MFFDAQFLLLFYWGHCVLFNNIKEKKKINKIGQLGKILVHILYFQTKNLQKKSAKGLRSYGPSTINPTLINRALYPPTRPHSLLSTFLLPNFPSLSNLSPSPLNQPTQKSKHMKISSLIRPSLFRPRLKVSGNVRSD